MFMLFENGNLNFKLDTAVRIGFISVTPSAEMRIGTHQGIEKASVLNATVWIMQELHCNVF